MIQAEPAHGQILHPRMHGPFAIFAVVTVAVVIVVAFSWYAASARITALESRLDELVVTLDQRLSTGEWRDEWERAAKRLEARVDERIRSERRHLTAGLDARLRALATLPASTAPTSGELAAAGQFANPTADSAGGSGLEEEEVYEEMEEEEAYEEMIQSMNRSLGLSQKRWAEVEVGLEEVLDSLWPEYLALARSDNPDTGDLRRRYCAGVESVLAPEEAALLGCGEGTVMKLADPPAAGTIPEPSLGGGGATGIVQQ